MFDVASAAVEAALAAGARYADARAMHQRNESMSARNGDVEDLSQRESVGVGVRARLHQPGEHLPAPTIQQRVDVIRHHLLRSVEWKGLKPGINEMRRHYTNYLKGLPNVKEFRLKLVTISEVEQVEEVLQEIVRYYDGYEFAPRKMDMDAMAYSCE